MWTNETIFSAGDLAQLKSCIERLQDELEITERFENELRVELLDDTQ